MTQLDDFSLMTACGISVVHGDGNQLEGPLCACQRTHTHTHPVGLCVRELEHGGVTGETGSQNHPDCVESCVEMRFRVGMCMMNLCACASGVGVVHVLVLMCLCVGVCAYAWKCLCLWVCCVCFGACVRVACVGVCVCVCMCVSADSHPFR